MSTLLEQASLVMIPSGYKEDVVYSVIPTSGAGDLTFTRASNGTRVNSAGLVEVCPWNLVDQSNTFGTSPWSNILDTGATLTYTANYGTAPDGTTTAGRLQMALNGSNYAQKNQIISVITGQQYTYSVWIKSLSGTKDVVFCYDNTNNIHASVTTEWQRFTHTFTGNSQVYARFVLEAGTSTSVDLLIYGAQLNIGSTAKPYFPTTDRLNVPRLTYQNGGGGCPSLLLEKQSTNLQIYSEQFDLWSNTSDLTVSANALTSPDGTQNADKLNENSSNAYHIIGDANITLSASTIYTTSFFAKASERSYARMLAPAGNYPTESAYFDLTNGNCSASAGTVSTQSMGNGWYKCIWTLTTLSSVSGGIGMWYGPARNMTDAYNTYTGTNGSGIYAYGAQIEQSSYPTSYIPTTSSSATRVADACYKTGISSLIGQTEGALFADLKITELPTDGSLFGVQKTASNFVIRFGSQGSNIYAQCYNGSTNLFFETTSYTLGTRIKMAFAYKAGSYAFYINGTQIATGTNATSIPACDEIMTNSLWGNTNPSLYEINEAVLFPTRLTNAELASLTTI